MSSIGDAGACGLGDGLKENSGLENLDLVRLLFFSVCCLATFFRAHFFGPLL
jgi:hypothetical protein